MPFDSQGFLRCRDCKKCAFLRAITLNVPTMFTDLIADSGTLLHEMVHQYLNERGELAGHDSGLTA